MGDKMGYLIWLGGHVNRGIASYLKTKLDGVDYEEEGQYIILHIKKPVTITKKLLVDALKNLGYPELQAKRMIDNSWGSFVLNTRRVRVEEMDEEKMVLIPTDRVKDIKIRLTYEEYEKLKNMATEKGVTVSDYVRQKVFGDALL